MLDTVRKAQQLAELSHMDRSEPSAMHPRGLGFRTYFRGIGFGGLGFSIQETVKPRVWGQRFRLWSSLGFSGLGLLSEGPSTQQGDTLGLGSYGGSKP